MSALRRVPIASPNHSGRSGAPRIVVVHTAEGSRDYRSLGNFFANPSSGVSSQTGIDDEPGVIGEYVRRDRASWTQASFNSAAISTELCAFAKWDRATWINEHRVMLENCRRWIAEECAASGIPLLRIGADAAQGTGRGVCGHVDLGSRGGGHWDPGPGLPWDLVLGSPIETERPPPVPPGLNAAVVDIVRLGAGYAMTASDGGVFAYNAPFHGSASTARLNAPIVGMAARPQGDGYWLAASDGGVFSFGDAPFHGSAGGRRLNAPVVGIAVHPSGEGYWLAAADGGVFAYNAPFHGSVGGKPLNAQVVDVSSSGEGYLLAASDGGVFNFGCPFYGSAGAWKLNQPVVGVAGRDDGLGYYLVAADGGIFAFGDAAFAGSMGGEVLAWPAVGIALGGGYWIGAADGGVFAFGAPFHGSVQG